MEVQTNNTPRGFSVAISGAWQAASCELRFPEKVWRSFPAKNRLINELSYILTLVTPLILKHPTVWYTTPVPRFFDLYNDCFERAIPNLVEFIPVERANDILRRFRATGRHFSEKRRMENMKRLSEWDKNRVVLPFSFGKDSLLSLATLRRLGYDVILVNIDERVLPRGKKIRETLKKKMAKDLGLSCHTVTNEIQLLSDYQVLERPETRLHQVHIYFVYLFAMIPFCTYYRAPTVVFSNEYHHSLNHVHKEGYLLANKVMQSLEVTRKLKRLAEDFSGGQISAVNLIGSLGNFAIHRILHEAFPDFGKYRITCHMEVSDYKRWCHDCPNCAQAFIHFLAMGLDPFLMGFEVSMLSEDKKTLFSLFKKTVHDSDDYHSFIRDEEALAFLMAYRHGAKGPLMDRFEKEFLFRIERNETKLRKRVFKLQNGTDGETSEKEAGTLYQRFLKKYRFG